MPKTSLKYLCLILTATMALSEIAFYPGKGDKKEPSTLTRAVHGATVFPGREATGSTPQPPPLPRTRASTNLLDSATKAAERAFPGFMNAQAGVGSRVAPMKPEVAAEIVETSKTTAFGAPTQRPPPTRRGRAGLPPAEPLRDPGETSPTVPRLDLPAMTGPATPVERQSPRLTSPLPFRTSPRTPSPLASSSSPRGDELIENGGLPTARSQVQQTGGATMPAVKARGRIADDLKVEGFEDTSSPRIELPVGRRITQAYTETQMPEPSPRASVEEYLPVEDLTGDDKFSQGSLWRTGGVSDATPEIYRPNFPLKVRAQ